MYKNISIHLKKTVADTDGRHSFKRHNSCLNPLFQQLQMKGQASTIAKELCEHKQWMVKFLPMITSYSFHNVLLSLTACLHNVQSFVVTLNVIRYATV